MCFYEAFKLDKQPRDRIFAILFLIALNPLFWGLFEQAGGSINLYTDRFVDRAGVPASLFQSINPIYIILLAPLFAGLWVMLGKRGTRALGSGQVRPGLAPGRRRLPGVRVGRQFASAPEAMTPVIFVFLLYLLHTTGELCLSPGRPQRDEPAGAELHGVADHGRLVLHDRGRQFRRRQDR